MTQPVTYLTLDTFSLDPGNKSFIGTPVTIAPFTIQAGHTGTPPQNNTTYTKYTRITSPPESVTNATSLVAAEYSKTSVYLNNILFSDYFGSSTTTVIDLNDPRTPTYTLSFVAIHSNVFPSASASASASAALSMIFLNNKDVFQIYIPIAFTTGTILGTMNPFLRAWMCGDKGSAQSFSINDLFVFPQTTVADFDYYTFYKNYTATLRGKYTICNFKTSYKVLPMGDINYKNTKWAASITSTGNPQYEFSFNQLFNIALRDTFQLTPKRYPLELSLQSHISNAGVGPYPDKTFYTVAINNLLNIKTQTHSNTIKLNSVKCYPIDLVTQVDETGSIFIDQSTSKPIDIKQQTDIAFASTIPTLSPITPTGFSYMNLAIIILIMIVLCIALITILRYIFSSRASATDSSTDSSASTAPSAPSSSLASSSAPPTSVNGSISNLSRAGLTNKNI